jgi:hypothetical protein
MTKKTEILRVVVGFVVVAGFSSFNGVTLAAELSDETGKLVPVQEDYFFGFESDATQLPLNVTDLEDTSLSGEQINSAISPLDQGIEGDNALRFSAGWNQASVDLRSLAEGLGDKQIEVRLWYLPEGIDLTGRLSWQQNERHYSSITLFPTGRATDDGWRELSSGPIHFSQFGQVQLSRLDLINDQVIHPLPRQSLDTNLAAYVDAIEIIEVGESRLIGLACSAPDEKETCGDGASCLLGRCVDSAFVWGSLPGESIAQQAVERRIHQTAFFQGIRKAHSNFEAFETAMEVAASSRDPQLFWQGQQQAFQQLEDGHLITAIAASPNLPNTGFCINAGEPDLILNINQPMLPMVFNDAVLQSGVELRKGDVISQIDNMPPSEWIDLMQSPYYIAPGDERSRLVMEYNMLNHKIAQAGALVEFKRCGEINGCDDSSIETFEVNFSELIGSPFWQGELDSWMFDSGFCEYRFDDGAPLEISSSDYSDLVMVDHSDGLTEIEFNGFASPRRTPEWASSITQGFEQQAEQILIDHRSGFGGSPSGLHLVLDHLVDGIDYEKSVTLPWFGTEDDTAQVQSAIDCNLELTSIYECGWVWRFNRGDHVDSYATQESKVALMVGWGVSGSDFLLRILNERQAPTKTFGISRFPGGYGTIAFLPYLLGEFEPPRLQIQDGKFFFQQATEFESGYGALPQEIVLQKQSDAIQGIDSIVVAAKTWLSEE